LREGFGVISDRLHLFQQIVYVSGILWEGFGVKMIPEDRITVN